MSAESHTDDRTDDRTDFEPPATDTDSEPKATASAAYDAHSVDIEPKPSAHCCGAWGCRETEDLQEVTIDSYGSRVVCPAHVPRLIERETR